MKPDLFWIDAFTDQAFGGNPAAVLLQRTALSDDDMRIFAAEMNLSETAFVLAEGERYRLRWFTPTQEVRLCGHATLAAAHALWSSGMLASERPAEFMTLSGLLVAVRRDGGILLDFPSDLPRVASASENLVRALGLLPRQVEAVAQARLGLIVEVDSEATVRMLSPDHSALGKLAFPESQVIVTAAGSAGIDFVSRFFAHGLGIPEDPVTGAAHCCLGPYWREKTGKREFSAYQASARGGKMSVSLQENDRVHLLGEARTIFSGSLSAF